MPNHWESSARPLFVKTVFVNGNRHAILFEKDPHRCGNSPFKKISRPSSSLSFTSEVSITSSESKNSYLESKTKNIGPSQRKDLSTELQKCLVKLKLESGNLENKNKSREEKCLCHSKEIKTQSKEKGNSKHRKHKGCHEKMWKRKQCEYFCENSKECKLTGRKTSRDNSCYVYNLENFRGKKNYCFVKISSQPPQFILNCSCENSWNETHSCVQYNQNNVVISATIHNLFMPSSENEQNSFDYVLPFENSELYWNNCLTRSYYNSLSERVVQWLDLTRKRKNETEKSIRTNEEDPINSTERIFSGKTFANVSNKNENAKPDKRQLTHKKTEKLTRSDTSEEDVEAQVVGESNVETLLSKDSLRNDSADGWEEMKKISEKIAETRKLQNNKPTTSGSNPLPANYLPPSKENRTKESNTFSNLIKSPLKIQDFFFNNHSKENNFNSSHNKTKIKDSNSTTSTDKPIKETGTVEDEKSFVLTALDGWEKLNKKSSSVGRCDARSKQLQCYCKRNSEEDSDKIGNQISTEEFAERNEKSINNLNITRTRPILIQNLLSPQQHDKISYLQEEKIVWASEKNTGRPQLHIFMPNTLLKDQSDDSMSECENFFNL